MNRIPRPLLLIILIAAGIVSIGLGSSAQQGSCAERDVLMPFTAHAGFDAACQAFVTCDSAESAAVSCSPHFLAERLSLCEPDNAVCAAQAKLHTSLIGLYQGNGFVSQMQPPEFWMALVAQIGDSDALLDVAASPEPALWFAPLTGDYGDHPMLDYVQGVLAELTDDAGSSIEFYRSALAQNSVDPLIYWALGSAYAAAGKTDQAALHYYLFEATTARHDSPSELQAIIEAVTDQFPLDLTDAEDYLLYPTLFGGGGPGGESAFDVSLEEPSPVKVLYREPSIFLMIDAARQIEERAYRVILPLYALTFDELGRYIWRGDDFYQFLGAAITATPSDDDGRHLISRTDIVFEGSTYSNFILAPVGAADPRPQGFRCEGSPQTRLADAVFARALSFFEPVVLYVEPGGGVAAEFQQTHDLIIGIDDGPLCLGGFTWYEVTIFAGETEQSGWIRENANATQYSFDAMSYD